MKTDYLVIGQGICGTLLSYELVKAGKNVLVMDMYHPATSSRVASGLINPVTGKRIVASWMIDELLPVAIDTYNQFGKELGVSLLQAYDIVEFYRTAEEKEIFQKRLDEGCTYLAEGGSTEIDHSFNVYRGVGLIKDCLLVDLGLLLNKWREQLKERGALIETVFEPGLLDVKDGGISYRGIEASHIILCNGVKGFDNPWFSRLPYTLNKGEALIADIPGLPAGHIYKQGIKIIPRKDGLFWVGASYEWKYEHTEPTQVFRQKVEEQLRYWLKLPFHIVGHMVSERPATVDYKPFVGLHPKSPRIGILNGMGSKGCSQVPYFAKQLALHLINGSEINPEVDIKLFTRVLCR